MSTKNKKEKEAIVSAMGVLMSFISILVELVKKFGGTMENIYCLVTPEGQETMEEIARIIVGKAKKVSKKAKEIKNEFLKLILDAEALMIDATDGSEGLADANDVFSYIDSDFKTWGADQKGSATKKVPASVYKMTKDGTYSQIFGSLSSDVRSLCWTPAQIKSFCKKHRQWLKTAGYGTFFLFESNNHFFVADVYFHSDDSLGVYVNRLEHDRVWDAEYRRRVVVPQLA